MRYYGTITRWNSKRGFGAATIEDTGQEIFLALAAFTTLTRLPAEGQHISFNITEGRRGRKEAENVCFALNCADCFDVLVPPPRKTPRRQTSHRRPDCRDLRLQHFRRLVVQPPLFRQHTQRAGRQKTRNHGSRSSRQNRSRTQSMARCRQPQQPTLGAASTRQR